MSDSNEAKVAKWMEKETLAEHLGPLLERYDKIPWAWDYLCRPRTIQYFNHSANSCGHEFLSRRFKRADSL